MALRDTPPAMVIDITELNKPDPYASAPILALFMANGFGMTESYTSELTRTATDATLSAQEKEERLANIARRQQQAVSRKAAEISERTGYIAPDMNDFLGIDSNLEAAVTSDTRARLDEMTGYVRSVGLQSITPEQSRAHIQGLFANSMARFEPFIKDAQNVKKLDSAST